MRRGIAVSPGISVGTAYCVHEVVVDPDSKRLDAGEVDAELTRYEEAREKAAADLRSLERKVETQVGREESAIFAVHHAILRDAEFTYKVRDWIAQDKLSAAAALHQLLNHYASRFARSRDPYLKERLNDVRDVITRISTHLSDLPNSGRDALRGPLIVIADELLPSHVVALGDLDVRGFVTQSGSQTSHAAIIARSRGMPAVTGVRGILRQVQTGDTIVVDGREGHVVLRADSETLTAYRKLEREFFDLRDRLAENRDQPAVTADGIRLELQANINGVADAAAASAMGAAGVGLYRTEYLYLTHPDVPDEAEQLATYREIIKASPGHRVTIRTLDIGGDKTVPYLGHRHQEANPFLGWRSIRLSFEHPDFFVTQIRAILRAAAYARELGGTVRMLFPMITTLEEIHRVRKLVRRACRNLEREDKAFHAPPLGMMLEVPAAAVCIDVLLPAVDFVAIGSNDLVQYLMAADRDNPKVSHLCQPMAPAVLRVIHNVIQSCTAADKPVTLCGEMAGQPKSFVLLLAMGLRSFSMSPAFVPSLKELALQLSQEEVQRILAEALKLKTTAQVKRYMADQLKRISPSSGLLDTA